MTELTNTLIDTTFNMPSAQNHQWYKIADHIDEIKNLAKGMTEIDVAGKTVCIGIMNNEIFACAHKCPHAGGKLAEGFMDGAENIVCPVHHYRFNVKNGRNTSGEGYFLKTFRVQVREEGIFIEIADSSLFGSLK